MEDGRFRTSCSTLVSRFPLLGRGIGGGRVGWLPPWRGRIVVVGGVWLRRRRGRGGSVDVGGGGRGER